jgi:hypothetical protein
MSGQCWRVPRLTQCWTNGAPLLAGLLVKVPRVRTEIARFA